MVAERCLQRTRPRDTSRGWAFCCSLLAHVCIVLAFGYYQQSPQAVLNLPGPIKVDLITLPAVKPEPPPQAPPPQAARPAPPPAREKPREAAPKTVRPTVKTLPDALPEIRQKATPPQAMRRPEPDLRLTPATGRLSSEVPATIAAAIPDSSVPLPEQEPDQATEFTTQSVTVDDPVQIYSNRIRTRINDVKRYPSMARRAGREGTVVVEFSIDRKGRLVDSRVLTSCGTKSLDNAALKALSRATPFPPLPATIRSPQKFSLQIHFSLSG